MHVILATMGTDGDVFPHVGLGAALHARGHRVTLAAPETYRAPRTPSGSSSARSSRPPRSTACWPTRTSGTPSGAG